jgi:hypothetical protein
MIAALGAVVLAAAIVGVIGLAAVILTQPWWSGRPHLALVAGVVGVALASYVAFLSTWIHPTAGLAVSIAIVLASAVIVWRSTLRRRWRTALPSAAIVMGVVTVYMALLFLWHSPHEAFTLAQQRFFSWDLPSDNQIPQLFADRLSAGSSTHGLIGDWNGSDRPPLQSGMILIVEAIAKPLGVASASAAAGAAFGASIVAQSLWMPALAAMLRGLGASTRATVYGVLMVAFTGTALVNTLYTWPKLLSTALVLCCITLLIDAGKAPDRLRIGLVGAALSLAMGGLAHGGAIFAVPAVVVIALFALRRSAPRRVLGWGAVAAVAGLIAYAPWWAYQRYVDPPGDRLLKWHLAGVIDPGDHRSLTAAISDSYQRLDLSAWLTGRLDNLRAIVGLDRRSGLWFWWATSASERRTEEFSATSAALGLALPLLLVVIAILATRMLRRKASVSDGWTAVIVAACLAAIAAWAVAMFVPGSTIVHQGAHGWLLLLISVPMAWLTDRVRTAALSIVTAQALLTLVVYVPGRPGESLSLAAVVVGVAGVLLMIGGVATTIRGESGFLFKGRRFAGVGSASLVKSRGEDTEPSATPTPTGGNA